MLRRARGRNIACTVKGIAPLLRGWIGYFRLADAKGIFEALDGWMRRRLRCILRRQWKRPHMRHARLMQRGLTKDRARASASNGRGPLVERRASHMNDAFRAIFFANLALISLQMEHRRLNRIS